MSVNSITVQAVFENGVFRPKQAPPLQPHQEVTLIVQLPEPAKGWPKEAAEIYAGINAEDRQFAPASWPMVIESWPSDKETSA